MRGVLWLLAGLAAGFGGPATAQGLTGVYCARGGNDALALAEQGGALFVSFLSWQDQGHTCGLEVRLPQVTGGWAGVVQGCTIGVVQEGAEVVLRSVPAEACRAMFCGARGTMDELRWPLAGKVAGARPGSITGETAWPC